MIGIGKSANCSVDRTMSRRGLAVNEREHTNSQRTAVDPPAGGCDPVAASSVVIRPTLTREAHMVTRRTFLHTASIGVAAAGLGWPTPARAQQMELKLGYMPHPIHENSIKWMKQWAGQH